MQRDRSVRVARDRLCLEHGLKLIGSAAGAAHFGFAAYARKVLHDALGGLVYSQ